MERKHSFLPEALVGLEGSIPKAVVLQQKSNGNKVRAFPVDPGRSERHVHLNQSFMPRAAKADCEPNSIDAATGINVGLFL